MVPGRTSVAGGVTIGPVGLVIASADGGGVVRPPAELGGVQAASDNARTALKAPHRTLAALHGPPPRPSRVIVLAKIRDQFYDQHAVPNRSPCVTWVNPCP